MVTTERERVAPIVEVKGITKSFGDVEALRGVDLTVAEGQVLGLLGPNGAGKTTLVRILSTLLRPDVGEARVAGFDVAREPMSVRRAIGLAGQFSAVDDALTGRENLEMIGRLSRLGRADARRNAGEVLERVSLTGAADRLVRTYSGGMRRRLDLGASLVAKPPVLLLDEPTTGLDPRGRIELWAYLRELVKDGTSLLLTTQYLEEADQMANEVVVIDHGGVIASGTPVELKERLSGDVLDVTVGTDAQVDAALRALEGLSTDAPQLDRGLRRIRVAVRGGADSLIDAAKRLDAAGISVDDLAIHRPSLDDVFLALTGHVAETESDTDSADEGKQP
jgi:daunorubicin resistance ABC transporter ATP-binding subunit